MPDDGVASNVEERLGEVEGQRAESSAARRTTDLDRGERRREYVSCCCLQCEMVRLHGGVRLEPAVQSSLKCNKQEHPDRSRDRNWKKKAKRKRVIKYQDHSLGGSAHRSGRTMRQGDVERHCWEVWSLQREREGEGYH